jgi:NAD(P)-dependent dehydrogenase (short-subunit alcohol dehydrogenase family)
LGGYGAMRVIAGALPTRGVSPFGDTSERQRCSAYVAPLTVALSEEVAKDGILVNAVAPSIMDTAANRAAMPKADYKAWPRSKKLRRRSCSRFTGEQGDARGDRAGVWAIVMFGSKLLIAFEASNVC